MAKLLYANFLDNKKVYNLAQAHWSKLLNSILKEHAYTFNPYINQIQNGQKEYDGNPIFSAYIPQIERAIRIIQVSPEEEGDDISAWTDSIELAGESKDTKELVVDLKLSKNTKTIAISLIENWITDTLDEQMIENLVAAQ